MIIGFTGSSHRRMSAHQRARVREILEFYRPAMVAHGGCINCDDEFDGIANAMGLHRAVFPSNHPTKSALEQCKARSGKITIGCKPMAPLARNPIIVRASTRFIATPKEDHEVLRSGTWATIRLARRLLGETNIDIIYPE